MEENENTELPSQPSVPLKSQETSALTPESSPPGSVEIKGVAPTLSQTETQNSKAEFDSMEVHKHPHHVMHKKKWSEYLLEFFMLFLAVFLGFVAENIREHIVEHEREKKFAGRLLSDLKQDSAFFQTNIRELRQRQRNQAEFFKIMSGATKVPDSTVLVSFFNLLRFWNAQFTTATYNQMKMSGSLRYIRNDELTSKIQQYYDNMLPQIEREVTDVRKVFTDRIVPYMIKHFKFQDLQNPVITRYVILNRTSESDQELINTMGAYGGGWDAVFELHQQYLQHAQKLIRMIKDDYHSD